MVNAKWSVPTTRLTVGIAALLFATAATIATPAASMVLIDSGGPAGAGGAAIAASPQPTVFKDTNPEPSGSADFAPTVPAPKDVPQQPDASVPNSNGGVANAPVTPPVPAPPPPPPPPPGDFISPSLDGFWYTNEPNCPEQLGGFTNTFVHVTASDNVAVGSVVAYLYGLFGGAVYFVDNGGGDWVKEFDIAAGSMTPGSSQVIGMTIYVVDTNGNGSSPLVTNVYVGCYP